MIDRDALLRDLQRELAALEPDLRTRLENQRELDARLRTEHRHAAQLGRTAAAYEQWREDQITQAAVAWLLACVFVRFCEDNCLVRPVWLAGPSERRAEALDAHNAYFDRHPERNDRDWLLEAFRHLRGLPATAGILDEHNPLWDIPPSADGAERLVTFWRRLDADGRLIHDFADPDLDARFLGDLYQDLSERAREEYALLQTPDFVEEFILDRTLERAIADRGLEGLQLIDPACGSGHFLLGAFHRLLDHWHRAAPGMDARERVQTALDSIHGVDLNPFAVAIAEFRLTVAALVAGGERDLERAPAYRYHLAVGDSLLHGTRQLTLDEAPGFGIDADAALSGFAYSAEDLEKLHELLTPGRYDVVVANPPYITVRDRALNQAYRKRYASCSGSYQLTVPFCERLFGLARPNGAPDRPAGWVGQIVGNAFMKREFGRKLIEQFLARKDLVELIDTSGAYIPGHGTPTLIMISRNQPSGGTVRAVLGIRGEPATPSNAGRALVWTSIIENVDDPGAMTPYVSVADVPRKALLRHPWSLSGGGAAQLKETIEESVAARLANRIDCIGRTTHTGADEAFYLPISASSTFSLMEDCVPVTLGDQVRDYTINIETVTLFPYNDAGRPRSWVTNQASQRMWILRSILCERLDYGQTPLDRGLRWFDHSMFFRERYLAPLAITFAFVATHNHFVLDRGGKVFNRSAPVIKLPDGAGEDDHLRLLGLLNSSTACFWLKQVSHNKGVGGIGGGIGDEDWEPRYEFTGTKLEQFPLPKDAPLALARRLDTLAQQLQATTPAAVASAATPTRSALDAARERWTAIRAEMISLQEELDWQVYRMYGLLDDDLTYPGDALPPLALGERAFEIVLARRMARGEEETAWFERHGSTPITELPAHWPVAYRELVERRIRTIAERADIALIERPECKRRWAVEPWEKREREALKSWVLDKLESPGLWRDRQGRAQTRSVARLADAVSHDDDLRGVLELYTGSRDYDLAAQLAALLGDESVPFLAAQRYKEPGLRKRAVWERVWDLQRREDAGEGVGTIPVPPKYASADFARTSFWRHRGKLDVPKERFIAYPGAERDGDRSPVYGWAGWDHLEQAIALATLILARDSQDGWPRDRLRPLLAGLAELEPWLRQWHSEPVPGYVGPPSAFISAQLDQWLAQHEWTRDDLAAWRPAPPARGRGAGRGRATMEARTS